MANRCKAFVVAAKARSSGSRFWTVTGTFAGRQIRRQFNSREDALAFAEERNTELHGGKADQSPKLTHLSLGEIRDAEAIIARLKDGQAGVAFQDLLSYYEKLAPCVPPSDAESLGAALTRLRDKFPDVDPARACDWFIENYRPPRSSVTLTIAIENYLADALRRKETQTLSERQYGSIGFEMSRFEKHFGGDMLLANLNTSNLQDYLRETATAQKGGVFSNKTWNNRRGYLTTFFKYCRAENWIDQNPAEGIRNYGRRDLRRAKPVTLSVKEAKDLMEFLETYQDGRMVPFFALCLFAGIRPDWQNGEISRLTPQRIHLGEQKIHLRSEDTKTRRAREIVIQPNLAEWLRVYPLERCPIICPNFKKLFVKLREKFKLGHDVLRHTYCSMLVGKFRSVGDAALQAGNSEDVIWSNYLNLVSAEEAVAFWSIFPSHVAGPAQGSD